MQDPPGGHMGNPNLTGDSPHDGAGIVLDPAQFPLCLTFLLFAYVPGTPGVERKTTVLLIYCYKLARMPDAYLRAQRSCDVPSDYYVIGRRNEAS
ncbi:hypothetical protein TNCV_4915441 [Trichonephila clavipes]|nr:hypothetical protein TNCV_4915441 [Trichonephila clavipes]